LLERLLVGECSRAPERVEVQRAVIGRRWLSKNEELNKEEDQERDGELSEEKALREREAGSC
jgi:hypothetical protein